MIDTHIHADTRSSEDFKDMYISGIDTAITCGYYPYKIPHEMILLNHLNRILEFDTKRAKEHGLDLKVALGIHPTNSNIKGDLIFENLYKWIGGKKIVAIGEIGLEQLKDHEIDIFKKQLEIADETKTKVIIHTPRKFKTEVLDVMLDIIPQHIDESQVVIDHVNLSVINRVIDRNVMIGLTVQPQKMDKSEAITILNKYGFDKFILNSDISNKPSDPLSVPKTIRELEKLGYKKSKIEKISHINAEKFFKI